MPTDEELQLEEFCPTDSIWIPFLPRKPKEDIDIATLMRRVERKEVDYETAYREYQHLLRYQSYPRFSFEEECELADRIEELRRGSTPFPLNQYLKPR
jgi:hypothetical protein